MNFSVKNMLKALLISSALVSISGCELLRQTHQGSAPVELLDTDLCQSLEHQGAFDRFCLSSHWVNYILDLQKLEWSDRLALINHFGDEPVELVQKILLSQGADTPYQHRLRAQNWINRVDKSLPIQMSNLVNNIVYENSKQLLEFESAVTILSNINSRQAEIIAELQQSLTTTQQQVQKQQSQVDQLLKIETDLIEQNRK